MMTSCTSLKYVHMYICMYSYVHGSLADAVATQQPLLTNRVTVCSMYLNMSINLC